MAAMKGQTWLAVIVGAGLAAGVARAQESDRRESSGDINALVARVDQCIKAWQPTGAERRLDEIGWAGSLLEAQRLAREHGRPVFLFTYNGCATRDHALALQRC
jgi:hypothetical protein